ncbi:transcription factor bHLH18 [Nicotiana tomentosiformis]|uniref:transcription factor bHLH18 n=1 Tax=Nicotiana tomentosiformis TaxID=4098 RepID=UPI00051B46D6|nr:transcription factor bHLH18 [Nicotiana tomentosiformis]XP_009605674.1 transcription factor bHLH18 [Nicotiana tomentosiformis]
MDMSSATWWSEMEIMNMNDLQYVEHCQTMTASVDELPFDNNYPFSPCTYGIQAAEILEEKPAFWSSRMETDHQNTYFSSPSPSTSPPPSSSSPSVISFCNTNSPSIQNYHENLNSSVKTEVPSGTTTINFSSQTSPDFDFDDSQHLFQATGFGAGDINQKKSTYSRTPLQAQDHVLSERKRRERLTQRFISLSTLIPNLKKLDKASILGDAIKYIKQLENQVKSLEEETKKFSEEPVVAVKRTRLLSTYDNSSSSDENSNTSSTNKSVPDIEVRAADGNVLIRIYCKKQATIIKEIFSQVEKFNLTIISNSVMPFGDISTYITIVAKMDYQLNMTAEYVAKRIREAIMKLISSHIDV